MTPPDPTDNPVGVDVQVKLTLYVLKIFVAAAAHVGAVTAIVGTAGVGNIAPPLYVKLAVVAKQDEVLVAVIV